jgi:hypothetical protein
MDVWHRWGRPALLAAALAFFGTLAVGPWVEGGPPATGSAAARAVEKRQPRCLLLIRHAEKPADDQDIHLTSQGAGRAAALPSLFLIPPTFPTKPAPYPTPDFLFATKQSSKSNRPVETVQPLSRALGNMPLHDKHADKDFQPLVNHVFGDAKYAGKTVLICWHHGKMRKLALAICKKAKNGNQLRDRVPERWDDKVFDRVWQFTFDDRGGATFADQPQRLLFGDSAK